MNERARPPVSAIPYTPRAKKVLALAVKEAGDRGHNYIGTEHILVGLLRENEGYAGKYLAWRGCSAQEAGKIIDFTMEECKSEESKQS